MLSQVLVVARKEIVDGVRDRRALGSALAYAVAAPLLAGVLVGSLTREPDRGPFPVGMTAPRGAPDLVRVLERERLIVVPVDDASAAVRDGRVPVAVEAAGDFAQQSAALRPAAVYVYADSTRAASRGRAARVRGALGRHSAEVAELRLIARGVAPSVVSPLQVEERDTSTAQARSALALATLPLFLMLAPFACGLSAAIDATAGERERGSLEPLLLAPVSGAAIALGKWAAVCLQTAAGVLATAAVAFAVFRSPLAGQAPFVLDAGVLLRLLVIVLPLALFAAAVMLLTALLARSFKEAQAQSWLLLLLPMAPGFLFAIGGRAPSFWMTLVPMLGQQLQSAGLLRGEPSSLAEIAALAALTSAATAACVQALGRRLDRDGAALVG